MCEMYIKTVPVLGIANNYQKEIESLNERMYYSIIGMLELTPVAKLNDIVDKNLLTIGTNTYTITAFSATKNGDYAIYLDGIKTSLLSLPIETKLQLVKILDLES